MKSIKNPKVIVLIIIAVLAVVGVIVVATAYTGHGSSSGDQFTDMLGRSVDMPATVNKVYSLSASSTVLLYMLAPEKMVGWDSQRSESQNTYMSQEYSSLPVLGGGKKNANYESILSSNPDIVLVGHGGTVDDVNEIQEKFGEVPVLDVEGDNNLTDIVSAISFVGKVTGETGKADNLTAFYKKVLNQVNSTVSTIPENEKKKVYYAKDSTGLKTYAPGSPQTQLISICGGTNVVQAPVSKGGMGVSMELILQWNPDVIITSSSDFYNGVYSNSQWQNITAVKNRQVYLAPQSPFNWFEGPPGANTIMGIPWTAKVLYPDKFQDLDLNSLTKEFYSEFYHYNLTDEQVSSILSSSGLNQA
ncbi:hypothetical protein DSECCO2_89810 [anaerobic digester metagenome]